MDVSRQVLSTFDNWDLGESMVRGGSRERVFSAKRKSISVDASKILHRISVLPRPLNRRIMLRTSIVMLLCFFGFLVEISLSFHLPPSSRSVVHTFARKGKVPICQKSNLDAAANDDDDSQELKSSEALDGNNLSVPICRIVSRADSRLPTKFSTLPESLSQSPHLLDKLDALYHAQAHKQTQGLHYLDQSNQKPKPVVNSLSETALMAERQLVSVTRNALEDAGFELLSERDIDLCESLNAGYLLRLSILPDVTNLDPGIAKEFYPERFHSNGTVVDKDELLFDGRVLVYWRGYAEEETKGRLLLPKLDYLQASFVQRSAAWLKMRLDKAENQLVKSTIKQSRKLKSKVQTAVLKITDSIPAKRLAQITRDFFQDESDMEEVFLQENDFHVSSKGSRKLGRYGGSKIRFVGSPNPSDALAPFTICDVDYDNPVPNSKNPGNHIPKVGRTPENATIAAAEHDMYKEINNQDFTCEYDQTRSKNNPGQPLPRMQLLERVSISDLVDVFTKSGRQNLVKTLFAESKLVEPTYEEVSITPISMTSRNIFLTLTRNLLEQLDLGGCCLEADKTKRTGVLPAKIH